MTASNYLRYSEDVSPNPLKKVKKVTVTFKVQDLEGLVRITDIMLQAGSVMTGYMIKTDEMLKRTRDTNGNIKPPKFYNGIVRGEATVIVPNNGNATTGLNVDIRPINATTGDIKLSTYYNTRSLTINESLASGDILSLKADSHTVLKNGTILTGDKYGGAPVTSPAGGGKYTLTMHGRDSATTLFTVTEVDKSGRNY